MAKPGVKVRVQAARALQAIIFQHQSLDDAVDHFGTQLPEADQRLLQAICYGVMRHYTSLSWLMSKLANRSSQQLDELLQALVLSGIYQLRDMRVPAHAAIHASVEAVYPLKLARAKGMVNAILRNYQRRADDLTTELGKQPARHDHPQWLVQRLQQDWPDHWQAVIEANNQHPPMVLRLDTAQCDMNDYLQQLQDAGLSATQHEVADNAVVLDKPADVLKLPGFARGLVSVQDAAAQLAVPLLQAEPQHRVLDACAAPGGKTAQIWQWVKPEQLDAVDVSKARLARVEEALQRIGGQARCLVGDASEPEQWWDGEPYDRILLDAPCSASGVIRRHPDIKHHRGPESLTTIVERQRHIMDALWSLLKPGGIMVYVTCSVFKSENEQQAQAFDQRHADARLLPIEGNWGLGDLGRQVLPGQNGMDGFYFAPMVKQAD